MYYSTPTRRNAGLALFVLVVVLSVVLLPFLLVEFTLDYNFWPKYRRFIVESLKLFKRAPAPVKPVAVRAPQLPGKTCSLARR
ncbi:hypothetical protein F6X40_10260 [Paraburkholderia sp. UCT31]|uniref:hypothetical protein n=1 Tax=Paraburkholderia sp. UCT31 TaxID=2615209 RepID=UPI00165552FB|nr:hypothetical protein [Paraburkholderia sp. UCT31]MBC8737191.1 hypothetical protein [Paraburkholderia sp. UCT31]